MPFRAALGWLVRKDFLYSVSLPFSASFASPRCAATPLFHSVQFSRRTSSCQTPFTHTRTHAHTPQRGHLQHRPIVMALPDTAPLLVGLLLLFHAFGGEEPRHSYHSCMGYLSYMQMCFFFHVRQKGIQLRCLSVKHQLLNCNLCSVEIHQRNLPKRF